MNVAPSPPPSPSSPPRPSPAGGESGGDGARRVFRRLSRRVRAQPLDVAAHLLRVDAALLLEGTEPAQGALADFFHAVTAQPAQLLTALTQARARLLPGVAATFERHLVDGTPLPRAHPAATRWSVLTTPSMDVPARARRIGPDDSHRVAAAFIAGLRRGDAGEPAEQRFLDHCVGSRDALAFMLARQALRRDGRVLAPRWREVGQRLQKHSNDGDEGTDRGVQRPGDGRTRDPRRDDGRRRADRGDAAHRDADAA